jgi:hypothetical protein
MTARGLQGSYDESFKEAFNALSTKTSSLCNKEEVGFIETVSKQLKSAIDPRDYDTICNVLKNRQITISSNTNLGWVRNRIFHASSFQSSLKGYGECLEILAKKDKGKITGFLSKQYLSEDVEDVAFTEDPAKKVESADFALHTRLLLGEPIEVGNRSQQSVQNWEWKEPVSSDAKAVIKDIKKSINTLDNSLEYCLGPLADAIIDKVQNRNHEEALEYAKCLWLVTRDMTSSNEVKIIIEPQKETSAAMLTLIEALDGNIIPPKWSTPPVSKDVIIRILMHYLTEEDKCKFLDNPKTMVSAFEASVLISDKQLARARMLADEGLLTNAPLEVIKPILKYRCYGLKDWASFLPYIESSDVIKSKLEEELQYLDKLIQKASPKQVRKQAIFLVEEFFSKVDFSEPQKKVISQKGFVEKISTQAN